jgi:UDP-2,3-diacylglucosamine hydrolase
VTDAEAPIGLIAGRGALPIELMEEARRQGRRIVCVDIFEGDPQLREVADVYYAVPLGGLAAILDALRRHGVREVLLAGKVDKFPTLGSIRLDAYGALVASRTRDHRDTSIVGAFLAFLQTAGFEVGHQARYLSHLVPGPGVLSQRAPSDAEAQDITAGLRVASQLAALDVGQSVAIRRGAVVAVEAAEGTDEMIRRAGELSAGVVVVKVSRPQQDPRYDLPVVGPQTIRALVAARGTALAVEAGRTLLVGRAAVIAAAAASGIAIVAAAIEPTAQ